MSLFPFLLFPFLFPKSKSKKSLKSLKSLKSFPSPFPPSPFKKKSNLPWLTRTRSPPPSR